MRHAPICPAIYVRQIGVTFVVKFEEVIGVSRAVLGFLVCLRCGNFVNRNKFHSVTIFLERSQLFRGMSARAALALFHHFKAVRLLRNLRSHTQVTYTQRGQVNLFDEVFEELPESKRRIVIYGHSSFTLEVTLNDVLSPIQYSTFFDEGKETDIPVPLSDFP
jgi:hypothetical protein